MSSQAQEHCATVQDIAHVGRRYVIIRARADHQFSHAPGQFTKITFTDSAGSFSRFYSLASAPRGDASFELCLILDDIRLRQIVETWDIGSEFSCSSPAGRFFVPATDVPVVAIAGGSGITPLKSIIESRVLGILPSAPSTLLYGCKRDDEIPFYDALHALRKKNPQFKLEIFAEETPLQKAILGRPQDFLSPHLLKASQYLLCGPPPFMEAITQELEKLGVAASDIHRDRY